MRILVMGTTGYVGGRLTPRLVAQGHQVRALSRRPSRLSGVRWARSVEVVGGGALERPTLLRLEAEMKLPGNAWLEFRVREDEGRTVLHQHARFEPRGLGGILYWWWISPAHRVVFASIVSNLARAAGPAAAQAGS